VSLLQAYDVEQFGAILMEEEDNKAAVASEFCSSTSDAGLDFGMDMEDADLKELGQQAQAAVEQQDPGEASFDSVLPKVFLGSGVAPLVVLKNETNLPGVKTFAYWSNQGAGLRAKHL
jgi:hypothetical protein